MDKQLERCLGWALKDLSEHEAWAVKEEVNNAIRKASGSLPDELARLKIELARVKTIKRLAEEHLQEHITPHSISFNKYKEADEWSANPYKDYVDASIRLLAWEIIEEAGSAEEAGINKQGEEFHPDGDCPKCGGELGYELRLCDCGWFDNGNADLLADMRTGK